MLEQLRRFAAGKLWHSIQDEPTFREYFWNKVLHALYPGIRRNAPWGHEKEET